jgi:hypothetical protein
MLIFKSFIDHFNLFFAIFLQYFYIIKIKSLVIIVSFLISSHSLLIINYLQ